MSIERTITIFGTAGGLRGYVALNDIMTDAQIPDDSEDGECYYRTVLKVSCTSDKYARVIKSVIFKSQINGRIH